MMRKAYLGSGIALLALYAILAFSGWEFGTPERQYLTADVRNSPGGYRSFHFWHAGYHGGK
jgi:hypothetical protein